MLYMVIERFHDGNAIPIYRRLRDQGRMMPDGLNYVSSWITDDLAVCFQVMETDDVSLLREWATHWADLMDFEVLPVLTSTAVRAQVASQLDAERA